MDRIPNYSIFEKGSQYWTILTDDGAEPVPNYVVSRIMSGDKILEERKHPVKVLVEGKQWMTNYSDTIY